MISPVTWSMEIPVKIPEYHNVAKQPKAPQNVAGVAEGASKSKVTM